MLGKELGSWGVCIFLKRNQQKRSRFQFLQVWIPLVVSSFNLDPVRVADPRNASLLLELWLWVSNVVLYYHRQIRSSQFLLSFFSIVPYSSHSRILIYLIMGIFWNWTSSNLPYSLWSPAWSPPWFSSFICVYIHIFKFIYHTQTNSIDMELFKLPSNQI